jgi:uncharacterized protein (UPF0335 family)
MTDIDIMMKRIHGDGRESLPFTADNLKMVQGEIRARMKETPADLAVRGVVVGIAAQELRQFIERIERLEAEKKDIVDTQKEVMAEAKGRGYDTTCLRKIVAIRKRDADDVAEEQTVMDLYMSALGM